MSRGRKQKRFENDDGTVECTCCKQDKDKSEFFNDSSKPLGIQSYCKKCNLEKKRKRRLNARKRKIVTIAVVKEPSSLVLENGEKYEYGLGVSRCNMDFIFISPCERE